MLKQRRDLLNRYASLSLPFYGLAVHNYVIAAQQAPSYPHPRFTKLSVISFLSASFFLIGKPLGDETTKLGFKLPRSL